MAKGFLIFSEKVFGLPNVVRVHVFDEENLDDFPKCKMMITRN